MVKAVIFDIDGTLIDSVDMHARAWQETFLRYGVETDFRPVRDQIGKGGDKLMQVFLSEEQIKSWGKKIEAERTELFKRQYLPQVKPFPGLQDLFERLRKDEIKMALASSAKDWELILGTLSRSAMRPMTPSPPAKREWRLSACFAAAGPPRTYWPRGAWDYTGTQRIY